MNDVDVAQFDRSVERTFLRVLSAIWKQKLVFAVTWALAAGALFLAILAIRPSYEATTLLVSGQASLEVGSTNPRPAIESPQTLSRIAESDAVLRQAVSAVGLAEIAPWAGPDEETVFTRLRVRLFGAKPPRPAGEMDRLDAALPMLQRRLSVRAEPTSGVIRITFRHEDPALATGFVNAVAQAFVDRQIALYSRPGAVEFFLRQRQRFEQEFAAASERLERFSRTTGVFAAEEQRELLLRRLSELDAALAQTRNSIAEKTSQRQALADQLRRLAPVARSNYVSSLVDSLAGERAPPAPRALDSRAVDERAADPPILLVRVYQDSMVSLFQINADLSGAQARQRQLQEEQQRVTTELGRLAELSEEFVRLRRAVAEAVANIDLHARRMVEEQINAELSAARFSSVRVMQRATEPQQPVFPNYSLSLVVAVAVGLVTATTTALLLHLALRPRRARMRIEA